MVKKIIIGLLLLINIYISAEDIKAGNWGFESGFCIGPETGLVFPGHFEGMYFILPNLTLGAYLNTGFPAVFNEGFGISIRYFLNFHYFMMFMDTALSMLFVKNLHIVNSEIATFSHITPKIGICLADFPYLYVLFGISWRLYEDNIYAEEAKKTLYNIDYWNWNLRIGIILFSYGRYEKPVI